MLFLIYKKYKTAACLLLVSFVLATIGGYAAVPQIEPRVNLTGLSRQTQPLLLKGLKIDPNDPLRLEFIIEQNDNNYDDVQLKSQGEQLIRYFLAALTVPASDLWVNLSPYEKERIVPQALGDTDFGRDLLGEDYLLKQLAASLTYPETEQGKKYWEDVNDPVGARHASPAATGGTCSSLRITRHISLKSGWFR